MGSIYQVVVLFFDGADDREALSYARRMLDQPYVHITLFHFSSSAKIVGGTKCCSNPDPFVDKSVSFHLLES